MGRQVINYIREELARIRSLERFFAKHKDVLNAFSREQEEKIVETIKNSPDRAKVVFYRLCISNRYLSVLPVRLLRKILQGTSVPYQSMTKMELCLHVEEICEREAKEHGILS